MAKNKYIYGAVCKSRPVPNPSTVLTENLPETHNRKCAAPIQPQRGGMSVGKASQKRSIKKANFLFFLSFISLVILTMPTTLWADLVSLTIDAGGDNLFRGGVDRVLIIFTVDDDVDADGDPYVVEVGTIVGSGENARFSSLGVIDRGTVSANETVELFWGGTINNRQLADDTYTIRVTVDEDQEEAERFQRQVTLDSSAPRISNVRANSDTGPPITDGGFINEPLRSIVVTGTDEREEGIDLGNRRNTIFLRNARQAVSRGTLNYDDTAQTLTFTLVDPLDEPSENGNYTLILILIDKAGNVVQSLREFTFDNVKPRLTRVATNRGVLTPGGGVNQRLSFVEALFTDNLGEGINILESTIRLTRLTDSDGTPIPGGGTPIPGDKAVDTNTGRIRLNLLSPLLGTDASQDGEYRIEIEAFDKAGNQLGGPDDPVYVLFYYDNVAPRLVSLSPTQSAAPFNLLDDTIYYNRPINGFVAEFEDSGLGVDLTDGRRSTRIVFGTPKKSGEGLNVREGRALPDEDNNTLTYVLNEPIVSRDGSQDGTYTLDIRATDTAGNTKTYDYQLIYDTQVPTLVSTTPASNETVSELSQVQVKLNEVTSGIDFVQSTFQLTRDGVEVPVNVTSNGIDTATLTLTKPIALDGSDDGTYTIAVTPADLAGNGGDVVVVREFYLVSQKHEPEIRLAMPETTSVNSLMTVSVELIGYIGAGIDFDASTVVVRDPEGVLIPQEALEHSVEEVSNPDSLTWTAAVPVARDGSADGEYIVTATFVDFTGRLFTQEFPIILDTQIPALVSTVPAANEIVSSLSQVEVKLSENVSGIDFVQSTFRLTRGDAEVPVNITSNGTDTVILTLAEPIALDGSDDGTYAIEVSPIDRASNTGVPVVREFYLIGEKHEPEVRLVMPETSVVNGLPTIVVELIDYIGSGVDFDASTVTVSNPRGVLIPQERLEYDETSNQLTWNTLATVSRDGSADGEYTITATFVDFAERRFTQEFLIVLDTQIPALVSTVPATNQTVSALSRVQVRLSENTSGIDFVQSTFRLTRGDAEVPVNITSNNTGTVTLTLAAPIALDGSDDGTYTIEVTPTDRAGNTGTTSRRKFYLVSRTHEPEIRLTMPETTRVNSLMTVGVELIGYVGAGIDFDASTVTVRNPQGGLVPQEELEHNVGGVSNPDSLTWSAAAPFARDGSADGEYTITATFVDWTGRRITQNFSIVLDTLFPKVENVQVATGSQTPLIEDRTIYSAEPIVEVTVVFDETSNDVDFEATLVSLVGQDGTSIPVTTVNDGQTVLTIRSEALTQDGEYDLSITPRDRVGNEGNIIYRKFVYDTEAPHITVPTPLIFNQQPVTYIGSALRQFQFAFTVEDVGPADLYLEAQTIEVSDASGVNIPVALTHDELANQLYFALPASLPRDGSVDGEYTVKISLVDKAGNRSDSEYTVVYDSKAPQVASVVVNADPLVELVPNRIGKFVEPINSITVQFEDITQINFANTQITLVGPESSDISDASMIPSVPLTLEDNGVSQVTLSFLDLEQVGTYTLSVTPQDVAGNASTSPVDYRFVLDMPLPQVSSVVIGEAETDSLVELLPNRIAEIEESISSITLQFEGMRQIDFANTQITLMGPESFDESGAPTTPSIPLTLDNDGVSQVTLSFLDLEQIGAYILSVRPQDVAGNAPASPVEYRFILDIPLPQVSSVVIGGIETDASGGVVYVNADNMIIGAFLLDPTETGLSFGSEGSYITVTEPDGTTVVPGATGSNREDLIVWEPITLTSDGTTDGRYEVYVVPIDKAGRRGSTVYREFIYDTQEPEIIAAGPIDLSQPVSYISQSLTQFNVTVADVGPADLELSDQKISLRNASGGLVPVQLTNDAENRLFLTVDPPFPLDGSMDGEYTLLIELTDKAGNLYTVEHLIVYDTQSPTLVSTVPTDGALLTEDVTQIQVTLNDEGGSGIDWAETMVTLVNPNGAEISGELVSDGETELTLTTSQLVEDGRYIIRVQAVDRAGNGDATDFRQSFILSRRLPAVVSTEPVTAPADEAFMNEALERVAVTLETDDAHDIRRHLSTLRLLSPTLQVVAGQLERSDDQLIYNLVRPLATDGSEDGIYTIEFTPISASGRAGEVQQLTFTFDTQAPEIESDEAINLVVAQPEVNNSLTEIHVNLTDETSGIDWENLDEEWLTFERLSPNPTKISGRISDDGQDNLTFRLTVPLADNGSADGEYRITLNPKDRAGNDDKPYERVFVYDTSPPMIDSSTLLINEAPLLVDINAENYPTAVSTTGGVVIQANIFDTGLGVNLAQSKITVTSPEGSEISGSTQQNGVDTLVFKSDGLTVRGVYKVTVMSIGNDSELLGFAPTDSLTTEFLYETTAPTAAITSDGGGNRTHR